VIVVLLKILFYELYLNPINFNSYAMKTKYISGLLFLFLVTFFSCKKELEPQESSVVTPSVSDNAGTTPVSPGLTNSSQNSSLPQQNSNSNAVGMNPPHGQAGHRCDIAVGAPLNSQPNKSIPNPTTTSSVINSPAPAIVKTNTAAVVTKPGMNPPHGQAGHRCDIAVGAPLNSPSNKNVPVPVPQNSNLNSQVPTVLKMDSTATAP
jgi:hypothetical protein